MCPWRGDSTDQRILLQHGVHGALGLEAAGVETEALDAEGRSGEVAVATEPVW